MAAPPEAVEQTMIAQASSAAKSVCSGNILEEGEIGDREDVDAGQCAAGDSHVRLAPQADIGRVLGDEVLHAAVQIASSLLVGRQRRFVEQLVDARIAEESTVESRRRDLGGVKHAPQDIGVGHGPADPLQGEQLKAAFEDVGIQRREFVRAHVERDADRPQILLDDRRLQPVELVVRHLQRQAKSRQRSVPVGIGIARFVEERASPGRVVGKGEDAGFERPGHGRQQPGGRRRLTAAQVLDDRLTVDRIAERLAHAQILQQGIAQVEA